MKAKKVFTCLVTISLLLILHACSNGNTNTDTQPPTPSQQITCSQKTHISEANKGIYKLHSDQQDYESLQSIELRKYTDFSAACALSLPNDSQIPSLSQSSDTLVLVDHTLVSCRKVETYGFTIPCYFKVYDNGVHDVMASLGSVANGLPTSWQGGIEEINGSDPNSYLSKMIYTEPYYLLNANYGDTYNLSFYEGTDYKTYTVSANVMYFYFGNEYNLTKEIKLPVEKTKNGYFIVDISSLSKGMYLFKTDTNNEYFIEIK